MVQIDITSQLGQTGRAPERDMTTRIRRMSADINRALATAKAGATVDQLTNRVCRIIRRHGLDPDRATIRRKLKAQLAMRTELSNPDVVPTEEPVVPVPRQPKFAALPVLEMQPPTEWQPIFAPLPRTEPGEE